MNATLDGNCFACDRKLRPLRDGSRLGVVTADGAQLVYVGSECYRKIEAGWEQGYQPPKGGPRLYLIGKAPEKETYDRP